MKANERGLLTDSHYYHFYPSEITKSYYYYPLNYGNFFAQFGYKIERKGGKSPLLLFVNKGQLNLVYDNKTYSVRENQVALINCHNYHKYYVQKYCDFVFMHFSGNNAVDITNHLIGQNNSPVFSSGEVFQIRNEIEILISLSENKRLISEIDMSRHIYNCLCNLQLHNEVYTSRYSSSTKHIVKCINHIKQHINKTLSLEILAKEVNISPSHLSHIFKSEMGVSPIEYVAITRVNYAKSLLITTDATIREISDSLGYSSSSSFINAFRKRVRMTPRAYRMKNR